MPSKNKPSAKLKVLKKGAKKNAEQKAIASEAAEEKATEAPPLPPPAEAPHEYQLLWALTWCRKLVSPQRQQASFTLLRNSLSSVSKASTPWSLAQERMRLGLSGLHSKALSHMFQDLHKPS